MTFDTRWRCRCDQCFNSMTTPFYSSLLANVDFEIFISNASCFFSFLDVGLLCAFSCVSISSLTSSVWRVLFLKWGCCITRCAQKKTATDFTHRLMFVTLMDIVILHIDKIMNFCSLSDDVMMMTTTTAMGEREPTRNVFKM